MHSRRRSAAAFCGLISLAVAETGDQRDWRYCGKCHQLFFDGHPDKGKCAAGGGAHQAIGYNFHIHYDSSRGGAERTQYDWRFCNKCSTMFFDGYPNKGSCPGGGGHAAAGYMFGLNFQPPSVQHQRDWRFCNKCEALFFDGYRDKGRCPAGGGHVAQGYNFHLPYQEVLSPAQQIVSIRSWR